MRAAPEECCTQPYLSHNVSNTITVPEGQWDAVADFIFENRNYFAGHLAAARRRRPGLSPGALLRGDERADETVQKYGVGAIMSSGLIVDGLHAFDDNLWEACDAALGRGHDIDSLLDPTMPMAVQEAIAKVIHARKDWVRRAHKFARNYFEGDVLEDDPLPEKGAQLQAVGGSEAGVRIHGGLPELIEDLDNTKVEETIACGGGACEIL
jgi:ribonucleoside-triphosphate reductase